MARIKGLILSEDEVSQTIDLDAVTGKPVSDDPTLVRAIGQAIIDKMLSRIEDGKGVGGVKLAAPYSKAYADSLDFKAAGKSKNHVNMKLTGDMLGSVDMDDDGGTIKIKIAQDQSPKAFGHITGFKGHPTLDGEVKPRPFFGVTQQEIKEVLAEFKTDLQDITPRVAQTQSQAIKAIRRITDILNTEED